MSVECNKNADIKFIVHDAFLVYSWLKDSSVKWCYSLWELYMAKIL